MQTLRFIFIMMCLLSGTVSQVCDVAHGHLLKKQNSKQLLLYSESNDQLYINLIII